jgi:hypothetical protein
MEALQPRIIVGETSLAFLKVEFQPKELKRNRVSEGFKRMAFQAKLR